MWKDVLDSRTKSKEECLGVGLVVILVLVWSFYSALTSPDMMWGQPQLRLKLRAVSVAMKIWLTGTHTVWRFAQMLAAKGPFRTLWTAGDLIRGQRIWGYTARKKNITTVTDDTHNILLFKITRQDSNHAIGHRQQIPLWSRYLFQVVQAVRKRQNLLALCSRQHYDYSIFTYITTVKLNHENICLGSWRLRQARRRAGGDPTPRWLGCAGVLQKRSFNSACKAWKLLLLGPGPA